ncbi:ABC transporter ATP-binding protein [Vulcanimicrobium alpinum]|uniref:ABC transporter ATP-binding protein n=1 Tax=Vulcanimicrobium alpinum TaxID=3016050 RepID=A0AAN1XW74_UNVUL|nr:ABC transporter ATP-binding protein [Vulcanimicrobium alpinum]BDE06526.1 ABC transporter ATP-binding protein [Vulcanimicrobium alpinum]
MAEPILQARDVAKVYAGFRALDGVSIEVAENAVHAIIGPNGAGKTTFFNVLSGFAPATAGSVRFRGTEIANLDPAAIARMGMVRSFQINSVFPHLTVLDNVKIALQARTELSRRLLASPRVTAVLDDPARAALDAVGLDAERELLAVNLPYGHKRSLELAIALSQDPAVLLLDEPTAGMGVEDIERTVGLVKRIAPGRTIVLVEHNLRVVADLCDRVTVMQRGRVLVEGTYDDVRNDERVVTAYLGGGHH